MNTRKRWRFKGWARSRGRRRYAKDMKRLVGVLRLDFSAAMSRVVAYGLWKRFAPRPIVEAMDRIVERGRRIESNRERMLEHHKYYMKTECQYTWRVIQECYGIGTKLLDEQDADNLFLTENTNDRRKP